MSVDAFPVIGSLNPFTSQDVQVCDTPDAELLPINTYDSSCIFENLTVGTTHSRPLMLQVSTCDPLDFDNDGFSECDGDCDDTNGTVGPGFAELCDDLDNDCDESLSGDEIDDDGDGWTDFPDDPDCQDEAHRSEFPACMDGLDNDGDGLTDCEGGGDPHCDCGSESLADGNCADGIDNDCDGIPDDDYVATATTCGVGECSGSAGLLGSQSGVPFDTCDPLSGAVADDQCDGLDNDCNGELDELGFHVCGQGGCRREVPQCDNGTVVTADQCTPGDPSEETCDGEDNDCDGLTDGDDPDCQGGTCTLAQLGESCADDADCGSDKCKGRAGRKTCK